MKQFMSSEYVARLEQDLVASLARSGSVEVAIAGWDRGNGDLDSFSLCLLIRDGGVRLGEAMQLVKRVLDGEDVTVRLPFADHHAAVEALARIGARTLAPELTTVPHP